MRGAAPAFAVAFVVVGGGGANACDGASIVLSTISSSGLLPGASGLLKLDSVETLRKIHSGPD